MTVTVPVIMRIIGVVLAGFLWVHYLGMPFGLLASVATALLYLA
jgi:hypothetical protein